MTQARRCFHLAAWAALILAPALAALVSCGGGVVGSGGTGRSANVTLGTVNGFGSVIVDGLRYDDSKAPVYREVAPGNDALAAVKLGHRVSVESSVPGVASLVRIETALAGPVGSAVVSGRFTMLGQTVVTNAGASSGPITQYGGGYASAADVRPGDSVEVQGMLLPQPGAYVLQATRIDKLPAAPAYLRVTGVASNITGTTAVTLGAMTVDTSAVSLLPAGATLGNGQTLTVLALPTSLLVSAGGATSVKAAQLRLTALATGPVGDNVSGTVSGLNTSARTFTIGSLLVRYGSASLAPAGTSLSDNQYVLVNGAVDSDGALVATSVMVRNAGSDEEAELKGNISDLVAATQQFSVRGVLVQASTAILSECPGGVLANGIFVEVRGALLSTGVRAKLVKCESESAGASVERKGAAGAVDAANRSFQLTPAAGTPIAIQWLATTYFEGVSPSTLAGQRVKVEGQFNGPVLTARKIEFDN